MMGFESYRIDAFERTSAFRLVLVLVLSSSWWEDFVFVRWRRYREAIMKKRRRNPSDFPSVVVYSTSSVFLEFSSGLSLVSHQASAAIAVVEVVAEAYHAAGTRVVGADSAIVFAAA